MINYQQPTTNNQQPITKMSKTNNNKAGVFVGGMLLGSTVGTVIGVLIAPRSGGEMRQVLKKSARAIPELGADLSTSVQFQAGRLSKSARSNWHNTLTRLKEAIAAGIEASQLEAKRQMNPSQRRSSSNYN